ncbi:MAG: hypothetical protein MK135_02295 [Polyangiaceae bacterium]|nr:hypothetical protein [Polyangiaceae bacterium]
MNPRIQSRPSQPIPGGRRRPHRRGPDKTLILEARRLDLLRSQVDSIRRAHWRLQFLTLAAWALGGAGACVIGFWLAQAIDTGPATPQQHETTDPLARDRFPSLESQGVPEQVGEPRAPENSSAEAKSSDEAHRTTQKEAEPAEPSDEEAEKPAPSRKDTHAPVLKRTRSFDELAK